ncbi:MAG: glycosyltransferase [Candidatus Nanopelagicales bacterium]
MRVLVCTVVHHTTDARIFRRQIGALREAGVQVVAIAPWTHHYVDDPAYQRIAIPRAVGRRRWSAWRAARARISALAPGAQALVIHDPELLLVLPWRELQRLKVRVIWDVHEDLAAALEVKAYLPPLLRRLLVPAVHLLEHWAERRATLLLAESAYAQRFSRDHQVVLNLPPVPDSFPTRARQRQAIYVGSITRARGLDAMLEMAPVLAEHGITLRLIGEAQSAEDRVRIGATPNVRWDGALPNAEAMLEVEQSMVGLALLQDLPNYRHSMPTKILEYMAAGAAVVATPLPLSRSVLAEDGVLLPSFDGVAPAAAAAVIALCDSEEYREAKTRAAFARVREHYNWQRAQDEFVMAVRG